jgi:hypothetical protein
MMHLMSDAAYVAHLIEGWRQLRVYGLPGYEHTVGLSLRIYVSGN